jgi:GTPase SAR1 family protein
MINRQLNVFRGRIDEIVKNLHQLTVQIGHEELAATVSDLRNRINEPFMFVIVGEVKAGKSSFINALLETDKEICKVSPAPMTDTIQQIIYGEKEDMAVVNPYLKKLFYPIEILKEIAIVDTPGTNTIVANHQEITEGFIPACDLVVFVFESKNPYRQSAWEFFDFIHSDWRKKIIFVLQQKDLLPEGDLQINIKGVQDMAERKGIMQPYIFPVSAKMELDGNKEESGYLALRQYIAENITGGKAPILKLGNNLSTSRNVLERIRKGLNLRQEQFVADGDFRKDISQTLEHQQNKSYKQVDILKENLLGAYDRISRKYEAELDSGMSFGTLLRRSFSSIFNKDAGAKEWVSNLAKDLERELNGEMRNKLQDGVTDLADSIQQMAKIIDLKIRNSRTILKHNEEIFSDIAERRSNILKDLQDAFSNFLTKSDNFKEDQLFPEKGRNISPNVATGSGIAIVGMVLTALTNVTALDVTGGALTAIGVVFAGVTIGSQRKKIIGGYQTEMAKGRELLSEEIDHKLKTYISRIKQKIDSNFVTFDAMLDTEAQQIAIFEDKYKGIEQSLDRVASELK